MTNLQSLKAELQALETLVAQQSPKSATIDPQIKELKVYLFEIPVLR